MDWALKRTDPLNRTIKFMDLLNPKLASKCFTDDF